MLDESQWSEYFTPRKSKGTRWEANGHQIPRASMEVVVSPAAHQGRGFVERSRVSGERPIGTASFRQQKIKIH